MEVTTWTNMTAQQQKEVRDNFYSRELLPSEMSDNYVYTFEDGVCVYAEGRNKLR